MRCDVMKSLGREEERKKEGVSMEIWRYGIVR